MIKFKNPSQRTTPHREAWQKRPPTLDDVAVRPRDNEDDIGA